MISWGESTLESIWLYGQSGSHISSLGFPSSTYVNFIVQIPRVAHKIRREENFIALWWGENRLDLFNREKIRQMCLELFNRKKEQLV